MSANEDQDLAWRRLIEVQRELEDSRRAAAPPPGQTLYLAQILVERARALVRAVRSARGQTA